MPVKAAGIGGAPVFRTRAAGAQVDAVMGVVNGVRQPGSVRPLADTRAETLAVSVDKPIIEDYWYWADGVTVAINGAQPNSTLVIKDVNPAGAVVTTFDPIVADQQGTVTIKLKGDLVGHDFPAIGMHRLTVNSSAGQAGSAALSVVPLEGRTVKVTTSVHTLTQKQWYSTQIRITATGFRPDATLTMHLFDPVNGGFQVGRSLRADKNGEFRYTLQAGNAFASVGVWEFVFVSYDGATTSMGTTGRDTFTVTPSPTAKVGALTITPQRVTQTQLGTTGVQYALKGLAPWTVVSLSIRTSLGTDFILGTARVNGEGALSDTLSANGQLFSGIFTITARQLADGNYAEGTFTVTNADGTAAANPAVTLKLRTSTRLQTMDPAVGVTAIATGFFPDAVAYFELRDSLNNRIAMSSTSVTTAPAGATGRVSFTVNPKAVPAAGVYTVLVFSYLSPQIITRATLTITA